MAKQKDGRYRTKVKVGVAPDGKDINKWISGRTKKELEDEKRKAIAHFITGTGLEEDRLFGEYAAEWYRIRKAPFISASTQNSYRTIINKHLLPTFGVRKLRAIKPVELQTFVNTFEGSSKSQITNIITTLNSIFEAAKQDRLIPSNPAEYLKRPNSTPPEEKRALTDEERARMVDLFTTHEHGLYLAVMYYTGMRPGEVRGLQWGDLDWNENLIHVQRDVDYATKTATVGELKTKAADRYIPIAEDLRTLLYPKREAPGTYIFPGKDGKPLAQTTAIRRWIELMIACGLAAPVDGPTCYGSGDIRSQYKPLITPHAMRHNYITMCWENGLDIMLTMKLVGHSDYQTTRNIYTHLSRKHLDNAKAQLDAMFASKTKVARKLPNVENEA